MLLLRVVIVLCKVTLFVCEYQEFVSVFYRLGVFVIDDKKRIIPMTRDGDKTLAVVKIL